VARDTGTTQYLTVKCKGGYGLPFGKVDPGEQPAIAARRECREGTGIEVLSATILYAAECDGRWAVTYLVTAYEGELRSSAEGEARWLPFDYLLGPGSRFPEYNRGVLGALVAERLKCADKLRALGKGGIDYDSPRQTLAELEARPDFAAISPLAHITPEALRWVAERRSFQRANPESFLVERRGATANARLWVPLQGHPAPGIDGATLARRSSYATAVRTFLAELATLCHVPPHVVLAEAFLARTIFPEETPP